MKKQAPLKERDLQVWLDTTWVQYEGAACDVGTIGMEVNLRGDIKVVVTNGYGEQNIWWSGRCTETAVEKYNEYLED